MQTFLCFDIGGSKYNVGLVRRDGTVLARQKSLWAEHTVQAMLGELFCAGHAVLARCPRAEALRGRGHHSRPGRRCPAACG